MQLVKVNINVSGSLAPDRNSIQGLTEGGGASGLQPPRPHKNRNLKNRFCRYYDIKGFT
jgi:hypothetical protein